MAESFSWNKVLGSEGEEASASSPEATPSAAGAAPNGEPEHKVELEVIENAEVDGPQAETDDEPIAPNIYSAPKFTITPEDAMSMDEVADLESKIKKSNEREAKMSNYAPEAVDQSIYDMKIMPDRYENLNEQTSVHQSGGSEDVLPLNDAHIDDILRMAIERKASDIHLTVGLPPMIRLDGELQPLPFSIVNADENQRLIYDTLNDEQIQKFEQTHELDFGYTVKGISRFRFNVYMQRGSIAGALRAIPTKIPAFEDLGLPVVVRDIAKRSSGLVLVTGPTGSGKSTTIASMIDDINRTRTSHIMTIEDPIEYLHQHKKCMVNQRELHADTYSFHNALRAVLREDPDIILVGELRDLETIEAALTLAETGHLVFGTLHTRNAPSTIDRIIDVFPSDQQDQIRVLLGNTLEGVVSQQLLPRLGGGRIASIEIMLGTPAIKNLIREGKTHQMYSVIETSAQLGMQTMDRSLADIFRQGVSSYDECLMRSVDKEYFARLAKGG